MEKKKRKKIKRKKDRRKRHCNEECAHLKHMISTLGFPLGRSGKKSGQLAKYEIKDIYRRNKRRKSTLKAHENLI